MWRLLHSKCLLLLGRTWFSSLEILNEKISPDHSACSLFYGHLVPSSFPICLHVNGVVDTEENASLWGKQPCWMMQILMALPKSLCCAPGQSLAFIDWFWDAFQQCKKKCSRCFVSTLSISMGEKHFFFTVKTELGPERGKNGLCSYNFKGSHSAFAWALA